MTMTKPSARKLATQAEWTLVEASFGPALKQITEGRLKQKIVRARKLQDKYRDLSRQQRGEARGKRNAKSTRPAAGNANTVLKQEMFAEALQRFEEQLQRLHDKAASQAARAEKTKAKKSSTKSAVAKKSAVKTSAVKKSAKRAPGASMSNKLVRTGVTKKQAHVGARGRRTQARRDSR
jgi:hypothetical protein